MKYLVIAAFLLAAVAPAHAYIDGGSGSYVLQMAMAGVLALAFTIKLAWQRVRAYFADAMGGNRTATRSGG
jgi:Zn-dependent protease with chaperone function